MKNSKSSSSILLKKGEEENSPPFLAMVYPQVISYSVTNDPPQSPLKRGKKKILPPFKGGWGDLNPQT